MDHTQYLCSQKAVLIERMEEIAGKMSLEIKKERRDILLKLSNLTNEIKKEDIRVLEELRKAPVDYQSCVNLWIAALGCHFQDALAPMPADPEKRGMWRVRRFDGIQNIKGFAAECDLIGLDHGFVMRKLDGLTIG